MLENKPGESVAREMLTAMTLPGVPPVVLMDCDLKAKYASPRRPWPYSSPEDALACFQKVAADGKKKKYAGISVSIEKDVILRLEKSGQGDASTHQKTPAV